MTLTERKDKRLVKRMLMQVRGKITGGLSGNSHDRRKQRRVGKPRAIQEK